MRNTSPITALAHPNSLRFNPGRPCFVTEAGIERRIAEGRGLGAGENYVPWISCTDFSSAGYRRMVFSPKLGRIVHLLSELEWRAFLVAEFTHCVVDIRENFPLDRSRTREIARRLEINHPAPYVDDIVMTTDLYLTIDTPVGKRHVAWYTKYARAARKVRAQALLSIEREYHRTDSPSVRLLEITEHSFPRVLTDNIKYVRGAWRPPVGLSREQVDAVEASLRARASRQALAAVCEEAERKIGLTRGTALYLARHFLATHRWKVNMFRPITPLAPMEMEVSS